MNNRRFFLSLLALCLFGLGPAMIIAQNEPLDVELISKIIAGTDAKTVKGLLKKGADPNGVILLPSPADRDYAYFIARRFMFDQLYKNDSVDRIYLTPLMAASRVNNFDVVKLLLKKGANPDAADTQGKTSLIYSLANKAGEEVALYLLKKGANYSVLDYNGNSTLQYAVFGANPNGIHMTAGGGVRVNGENMEGTSPFHTAAFAANPDILDQLVSLGADVTGTDKNGMNALHYAAAGNNIENIHFLLRKNIEVNLVSNDGYTSLDVAMYQHSEDVALAIKKAGGRLNDYHFKELTDAIKSKELQKIEVYLKEGVNPNRKTETPLLHLAVQGGNPGIVEMLIRYGADVNATDAKGKTALEIAIAQLNYPLAVSLLTDQNRVKEDMLLQLIRTQVSMAANPNPQAFYELAGKLASKPFNLEAKNSETGMNALHYACLGGDSVLVKLLLDRGASVISKDVEDWSPVHFAAGKSTLARDNTSGNFSDEIKSRIAILKMLKVKGAEMKGIASDSMKIFFAGKVVNNFPLPVIFPPAASALDVATLAWEGSVNGITEFLRSEGLALSGAKNWYLSGSNYLNRAKEKSVSVNERNELLKLAEKNYLLSLQADTRYSPALLDLISVYFILGQPDKAIDCYTKGASGTMTADHYFHLGCARCQKKDFTNGLKDFNQALVLSPSRPDVLLMRGKAHLELKNKTAACADFTSGKQLGDKECTAALDLYCK